MEWQIILALVIVIPIVLFVPVLIWAAVVSGIYQVARESLRQRVTVLRRRTTKMTGKPVVERVTIE